MPRADEPRVPVRLSTSDYKIIEAAALSVNVAVGALMRECSVRYAGAVAREVAAGNITLRRQKVDAAIAATGGAVVPASSLEIRRRANPVGAERQKRIEANRHK